MELPISLRWLRAHNFQLLTPWHWEFERINSLKSEYHKETGKDILPFAGRQDNDTIAAFKVENGVAQETVLTIHLTWSGKREPEGYTTTQVHSTIFDWIGSIMNIDTQEWIDEAELEEIESRKPQGA